MPDPTVSPLGDHYFYFAVGPCPTEVEACDGTYTKRLPPPGPHAVATQDAGTVRCPGGRVFPLHGTNDTITVDGLAGPSVNLSIDGNHHVTIVCDARTNQCEGKRFGTAQEAIAHIQQKSCASTTTVPNGPVCRLVGRFPHTVFEVRRTVTPPSGLAEELERDLAMMGPGIGIEFPLPYSAYLPLTFGGHFDWMHGSPARITGADTTIDVDRWGLFGKIGLNLSTAWIRAMAQDNPQALWPIEFSLGAEWRFGYEWSSGTYQFPHSPDISIAHDAFSHHPAVMLNLYIPTETRCDTPDCGSIPDVTVGYELALAAFFGQDQGDVFESFNRQAVIVGFGIGSYEHTVTTPASTVKTPALPVRPLRDERPAAVVARPGVTYKLERLPLEDAKGWVRSTVLYFKTGRSDLTAASSKSLDELLANAANIQAEKGSHFVYLRYFAHADSRSTDAYNLKLSNDRAAQSKAALERRLTAHPLFGPILAAGSMIVDSVGYGETKPLDKQGRIIDAERCEKEVAGKTRGYHICSGEKIAEDYQKSRRMEAIIQGEETQIAIELQRDKPEDAVRLAASIRVGEAEQQRRVLPGGGEAFPLATDGGSPGTEQTVADFANYYLLRKLPRRQMVTILVSGANTPDQITALLPVIRTARDTNLDIVNMVEGRLGDGSFRAFAIVHPKEKRWDFTQASHPEVKAVLDELAK